MTIGFTVHNLYDNICLCDVQMETQNKNKEGPPTDNSADVSKLNGDVDIDHSNTTDLSDKEIPDTLPSGRPRRKATMKSLSPAKVNGKFFADGDVKKSVSRTAKDSTKKGNCGDGGKDIGTGDIVKKSGLEEMPKLKGKSETYSSQAGNEGKEIQAVERVVSDSVSSGTKGNSGVNRVEEDSKSNYDNHALNSGSEKHSNSKTASLPEEKEVEIVEVERPPSKSLNNFVPVSSNKQPSHGMIRVSASGTGCSVSRASVGSSMQLGLSVLSSTSVSTAPSMQWMLSQKAPGMQRSGVVLATTSAPLFQAAVRNAQQPQGLSHNPASLLHPRYTGSMSLQGNQFPSSFGNQGNRAQSAAASILSTMPDKPTCSKGMIDMIRWEIESHINIKPKYLRPNPKAELGSMAKWVFDLGFDIVKERVYHELVEIQHRRDREGSLSEKEKDDFAKLQEIDKDLNGKVGRFKYRMSKACSCGFRTELGNVKYLHQQHAHIERNGVLNCALCKYSTRQPNTFRFHMESEHGRAGYVENRPSFYECNLCPYESNYSNRLEQHQVRCQRNFRETYNQHPSSVSGPEVSMCLENIFYYIFTNRFLNPTPRPITPAVTTKPVTPLNTMQVGKVVTAATPVLSTATTASRMSVQHMQKTTNVTKPAVSHSFPSQSKTAPGQAGNILSQGGFQQKHQPNTLQQPHTPGQTNKGFEVCEICGGYVKDRKALRIHFFYAHRMDMPLSMFERPQPPLYCATCFSRFWTAQGLQKHILIHKGDTAASTQSGSVVAGKCILCSHRVPNILLHMRMVHNREMAHYLGAKMCIFCGCRLRTLREVENHLQKMHSVVVKSIDMQAKAATVSTSPVSSNSPSVQASVSKPAVQASVSKPAVQASVSKPALPQVQPSAKSKGGIVAKNKCVLCNVGFTRNVDLTRHCMRVHHTCMKCGLVVVDKESLARHNCLPCASGMRSCHFCNESGFHPAYYIKHMRDKHLRRCSVILRRLDQAIFEAMKQPITISDSEDDEPVVKQPKLEREDGEEVVSLERSVGENVEEERLCEKTGKIIGRTDADESSTCEEQKSERKANNSMNKGQEEQHSLKKEEEVNGNHKMSTQVTKGDSGDKGSEAQDQTDQTEEGYGIGNDESVAAAESSCKCVDDKPNQASEMSVDSVHKRSKRHLGSQEGNQDFDKCSLPNGVSETEESEKKSEEPVKVGLNRKRKSSDKPDSGEGTPVRKSSRRSSSKGDDPLKAD